MTHSYLPHTSRDRQDMLTAIGVDSVEALFRDVPADLRMDGMLKLPPALAESELVRHMRHLSGENTSLQDVTCFLGAGAYDHYIPSLVDHILRRSEFYTAYTQYQPEISQGYLQILWEFQSMICELTGMAVANASMYDGGTAVAEAVLTACAGTGRRRVIISRAVHPHYREVVETYSRDKRIELVSVPYGDGVTDFARLAAAVDDAAAAVVIQFPNFFGCVEDLKSISDMTHAKGACVIAVVDPISLGILESPGLLGADIVVGEGQSLGLPLSFGGPYLGFFAATEKFMRRMPGRIVGQTGDNRGNRGFVLTLQAREQHIRRNKATSNICSNEALCALAAAVYLATLGKEGFKEVAGQCLQKAHYAYRALQALPGCRPVFTSPFFKEFVVRLTKPVALVNAGLLRKGIAGGLDLGKYDAKLENCMLLCVTEKRTKAEIDHLVSEMGAIL
ncbi:putative glycine dehydrogenase [decarboxylating] subunit 1 [Propionispora sp. 2/2-37]|uniref:aminomethyl-transferring glycine dehydrogenase subunit GcvPA n=1 Tax=Propionispora sp. 2/2-37 TaxID=1677858 RepID=UPI0006BB68B0|nr:aminomethyl-transferring glycine dehydrogenase subunit GcvPA [Propionispora sp. 2/2-37]CUH95241.1 putative glycine dehydrogenase [decarboxylating] subunit 1 [Propionispora sp. 2/2-37]